MHRKLAFVLASSVIASPAMGLGLGNISVKSALNQPLSAEISVRTNDPGELSNVAIKLAPQSDFARAGLERSALLNKLRFIVVTKPNGTSVIKVFTSEPVPEPYLDFLLEVNWSNGRILREYTLLLDPPVAMTASSVKPVIEATKPVPKKVVKKKPAPKPVVKSTGGGQATTTKSVATAASGATMQAQESAGESTYGPVKSNDTLWKIAAKVKPGDSVTTHQTMIALFRENPEAFIGDNINRLKRGYVLRVPSEAEIGGLSHKDAVAETRQQTEKWRSNTQPIAKLPEPTESADGDGKLTIVAPDKSSTAAAQSGSAEGEQSGALAKDLALAKEELAAKEREQQDSQDRIVLLEERLKETERLLELRNAELKKLQTSETAEAQAQPEQPAQEEMQVEESVQDKPAMEEKPAVEEQQAAMGEKPEDAQAEEQPMEEAKPAEQEQMAEQTSMKEMAEQAKPEVAQPKPTPKPKPQPKVEEPDPIQEILNNPTMLGGIAAAVLALLGLIIVVLRRRGGDDEEYEEDFEGAEDEYEGEDGDVVAFDESDEEDSDFAEPEAEASGEEDELMQEIDLYIAHQRFEPAVGLINDVLAGQPDRDDLRMKLLEIYAQQDDKEDEFVSVAQQLHDSIGDEDSPAWKEVVNLGKQVAPNAALFGGSEEAAAFDAAPAADEETEEVAFEFDLGDLGEGEESAESADEEPVAEAPVEEESAAEDDFAFDSDLELDLAEATSAAEQLEQSDVVAEEAPVEVELEGVEFEVDDSDEGLDQAISDLSEEMEKVDSEYDLGGDAEEAEKPDGVTLDLTMDSATEAQADETFTLDEGDEVGTKLDLAKAYIEMGDNDGAQSLLEEVEREGDDTQKAEAREMLKQL